MKLIFILFALFYVAGAAADVNLAWEHSGLSVDGFPIEIDHFNIYKRPKNQPGAWILVGEEPTKYFTYVPTKKDRNRYYFAVSAEAQNGAESEKSNELFVNVRTGAVVILPAAPELEINFNFNLGAKQNANKSLR